MRRFALLLVLFGAAGCSCTSEPTPVAPKPAEDASVRARGCARYASEPVMVGTTPGELPELSGLAASRRHPGLFWAHNDSGNALELFAIRETGEVAARYTLTGAVASDVEDVAVGPCAAGADDPCIVLADIGDNLEKRTSVQLLRLPEPDVPGDGELEVEVLPFRYPDRPRDAEALVVDGQGTAWVISKSGESLGEVFRIEPAGPGNPGAAVRVGEIHPRFDSDRRTTAADLHPDGERLLLRTYSRVWELRGPGAADVEALLASDPLEIPSAAQFQAEAIAWTQDGEGYLLGSEGAGAALHRVTCAP